MSAQSCSPHPSSHETRPASLLIDISRPSGDTVIVRPAGEADVSTLSDLRGALHETIAARPSKVIVDLDLLTFMDATTLDVLAAAHNGISQVGGTLQVKCSIPRNRRLLCMTGLQGMLYPPARHPARAPLGEP